jgi:hypothetical protein
MEYGTQVSFQGKNVTFRQNLTSIGTYRKTMERWEEFIKEYGKDGEAINVNETDLTEIDIQPGLLSYILEKSSEISIAAGAKGNVSGYNLTVDVFDAPGIPIYLNNTFGWDAGSCDGSDAMIRISVRAKGKYSSDFEGGCWNRGSDRWITIESDEAIATIRWSGSEKALNISYMPGRNAYLIIVAELNSKPLYAELGQSTVTSASGMVVKAGRVRLA